MNFAPLAGVRVLDFTWNVAGPRGTRLLALLGAEVLKVEWPSRPDPARFFAFSPVQDGVLDSGGHFAGLNVGKRSLTLDPTTAEGMGLVQDLITKVDVVVESYSPRVMAGWGLTYERLQELNPGIIFMSVSGFGHTGPHRDYVAYGPTAQAASGVTASSGKPGAPPAGWGYSYLDVMTSYQGTLAVVAALRQKRVTASGARIDLSQLEVGAASLGSILLDAAVNPGRTPSSGFPPGNRAQWPGTGAPGYRHEVGAPYNLYPTADEGREPFCAITALTQEHWERLVELMGSPDWAGAPEFATLESRIAHQEELDRHVGAWTSSFMRYELMAMLQKAGVPAGVVQNGRDSLERDESTRARHLFQVREHEVVGRHRFDAFPAHLDGQPIPLPEHFPVLGKDTDSILNDVLGLPPEDIQALADKGVTWPAGSPRPEQTGGVE